MPHAAERAVFLSYASQDAEAARRLRDALRTAGVEVWFDQSELVGGDAWDQKIRGQIKSCALFVPMISANTQSRAEGYFRREWKLAVERTNDMADHVPFLLPVVLDATADAEAFVPEKFREVQWTRLTGGESNAAFVSRVKKLLAGENGLKARGEAPAASIATPSATLVQRRSAWVWAAMAAAVVVAFFLLRPKPDGEGARRVPAGGATPAMADALRNERPGNGEASADKSVAVLAFKAIGGDKENEYFAEGVSEELLNVLAKVPGLRVAARASAFYFKDKNATAQEMGHKLNVAYLVEGTVQRAGATARVTARLSRADTSELVWSEKFDGELKNILALQDEIAGRIAENLKLKLGGGGRVAQTVIPEAHRLMLEGWHFWYLRTEEGFARADVAFRRAIELDPLYARAYAGLANNYVIRAQYRLLDGIAGAEEGMALARATAQRAIELDPAVPEAYAALAYALANEGQFDETEPHFQTALRLNPSYAMAMLWHSQVLGTRGRLDLALAEGRRAAELDPLAFIIIDRLAEMLRHAGKDEEALEVSRRAAALRSDEFLPNSGEQAVLLVQLGRLEEAVKFARAIRRNPNQRTRWMADGHAIWALAKAGLQAEAAAHEQEFSASPCGQGYARGYALAALGRYDEALPYLAKSPPIAYRRLYFDRLFDPIRDRPQFAQLLQKLGRTAEFKLAREMLEVVRREAAKTK